MNSLISTDKSKIDVDAVHDYLCHRSYWAKGRSLEDVKKSIENSICFGVYNVDNNMLGFARVVTDKVVFAYLMDLFIFEEFQGMGLGTELAQHMATLKNCHFARFLRRYENKNAHICLICCAFYFLCSSNSNKISNFSKYPYI